MKLTEKYEILELLTSGRISTFRARERASQETMLVHTFACSSAEALPSSTAAILMQFASLAPNPPGVVLKAGLDEGSSSAYLVTKMPNAAVLQEWIHAYRVASTSAGEVRGSGRDATAELSAAEVDRLLAQSGRARTPSPAAELREKRETTEPFPNPPATPAQPQAGGEFTRLFQELGAFQPRPGGESPKPAPPVKPSVPARVERLSGANDAMAPPSPAAFPGSEPGSEPGSGPVSDPGTFTQQFFSASKKEVGGSTFGPNSTPGEPAQPGSFTKEFLAAAEQSRPGSNVQSGRASEAKPAGKSVPTPPSPMFGGMFDASESSSEPGSSTGKFERNLEENPESRKSGAGEFTNFFQGPFDQPSTPRKPIVIPDEAQAKPPREQTGDFTRVFGKGTGQNPDAPMRIGPPEPEPQQSQGSFTRIFGSGSQGGARLGTSRLDTGGSGSANLGAGPSTPPPAAPPPARTPIVPTPPSGQFSTPISSSKPVNVPSSSVDNTLVNRLRSTDATEVFRNPGSEDAPEAQGFQAGPSEFTQFLSRSQVSAALPQEPAMAPPAPAPQGPAFQAPPMPQPPAFQFAPPAPPQPPAIPVVPKPAFSAPQPPAVPGAPAAGPTSIWPLITVLTILIAIAAMLVMYFVLKH